MLTYNILSPQRANLWYSFLLFKFSPFETIFTFIFIFIFIIITTFKNWPFPPSHSLLISMELEAPSSSPQQSSIPTVDSIANPMVQDPPPLIATTTGPTDNGEKNENTKKKKKIMLITKNNNNKKRVSKDYDNHSSSSCSSSSSSSTRVVLRRRNPRPLFGAAPPRNVDAIALPLGMSVAAVVALVRNFDPPFVCDLFLWSSLEILGFFVIWIVGFVVFWWFTWWVIVKVSIFILFSIVKSRSLLLCQICCWILIEWEVSKFGIGFKGFCFLGVLISMNV